MRQSKRARDKAFEMTVPKQFPNDEQEQREQFFRPDESDTGSEGQSDGSLWRAAKLQNLQSAEDKGR